MYIIFYDLPLNISIFYPLDTGFIPGQASNDLSSGHENLPLDITNLPQDMGNFQTFSIPPGQYALPQNERIFFSGRAHYLNWNLL